MGRLKSPKNKGDQYERELAKFLDDNIFDEDRQRVLRAPLSGGGRSFEQGGGMDVYGCPDIWIEAKRTEKFKVYPSIEQAENGIAAKGSGDIPVVFNRRNQMKTEDSAVVRRLGDWIKRYRAYLKAKGYKIKDDFTK